MQILWSDFIGFVALMLDDLMKFDVIYWIALKYLPIFN